MADPEREPGETGEPITRWLAAARGGDDAARERLIAAIYAELRRSARRELRRFRGVETLQTTALVHEAYLRLLAGESLEYENRAHLLGVAAIAMRRLLLDRARQRMSAKRGAGVRHETLDTRAEEIAESPAEELVALDEALTQLEALDPRLAKVVELRFFGGLTEAETATVLGSSERTVRRDWTKARVILHRHLTGA